MIEDAVGMGERAASLRRAFDRAFAERPQKAVVTLEDLLAVRIATDAYAVRLTEINGLFANRKAQRYECHHRSGQSGLRRAGSPEA